MKPIPYRGRDNFIFISYAHRDSDLVWPIVENMQEAGYRVWYDEGIDPGTEWDLTIATHVNECGYFIAFVSGNYLNSEDCKDELNYARDLKKPLLLVYLEEISLPAGMAMRLNRIQSLFRFRYEKARDFYEKLFAAQGMDLCHEGSGAARVPDTLRVSAGGSAPKKKVPRREAYIESIRLSVYSDRMGVNYAQMVTAEFSPLNASDISDVIWSSSEPEVATVDATGKVISRSPGVCEITATAKNASAGIRITVLPQMQSIELSAEHVTCYVGETVPITVNAAPRDAYNKEVVWRTSDQRVAVVETTSTGEFRIRAVGIGECTLTCRAKEGIASASVEMFVDSTFNKRKRRKSRAFFS
ncbi:MAG: Ig-like domain-containing protein [Clostridiales bacterium]|nr:Ig-like domain-containing protein [Clostridiales bacterium]